MSFVESSMRSVAASVGSLNPAAPAAQGSGVVEDLLQLIGKVGRSWLSGTTSGTTLDISPEYRDLIAMQMQVQQEMLNVTMVSNIEKSKHESRMAAVRNIRVN